MAQMCVVYALLAAGISLAAAAPPYGKDASVKDLMMMFLGEVSKLQKSAGSNGGMNQMEVMTNSKSKSEYSDGMMADGDYCDMATPGGECRQVGRHCHYANNVDLYLLCTNTGWIIVTCPRNTAYNKKAMLCLTDTFQLTNAVMGNEVSFEYEMSSNGKECHGALPGGDCYGTTKRCNFGKSHFMYLVCSNTGWVAMSCPLGTVYNKAKMECTVDYHQDVSLNFGAKEFISTLFGKGENEKEEDNGDNHYGDDGDMPAGYGDGGDMEGEGNYCSMASAGGQCGEVNHRCYNGDDVHSYLVCSNQGWVEMKCPVGTWFNAEERECNGVVPMHFPLVRLAHSHHLPRQYITYVDVDSLDHDEPIEDKVHPAFIPSIQPYIIHGHDVAYLPADLNAAGTKYLLRPPFRKFLTF